MKLQNRLLMCAYGCLWTPALPLSYLHPRVRPGYADRMLLGKKPPVADVWLHAASGGEAYLAREILQRLPDEGPLSVLATTWTAEGLGILEKAKNELKDRKLLQVAVSYVPFDHPWIMQKAFEAVKPEVVVLLETEIWPGLFYTAAKNSCPVLMINGRIRSSTLGGLMVFHGLWKEIAPEKVLAVSETDARRFSLLFGAERVQTMPNIKFDRLAEDLEREEGENPLDGLIDTAMGFVVFGSVREEEEAQVLKAVKKLHEMRPDAQLGYFPKHKSRVEPVAEELAVMGVPYVLRSKMSAPMKEGGVILWDVFGELRHAYALARGAFVGGSLLPLGGQNFLEALACGVAPVMGPHYENFAWAGKDIQENGLVRIVRDHEDLAQTLATNISRPRSKSQVKKDMLKYVKDRVGGTDKAVGLIMEYLNLP